MEGAAGPMRQARERAGRYRCARQHPAQAAHLQLLAEEQLPQRVPAGSRSRSRQLLAHGSVSKAAVCFNSIRPSNRYDHGCPPEGRHLQGEGGQQGDEEAQAHQHEGYVAGAGERTAGVKDDLASSDACRTGAVL